MDCKSCQENSIKLVYDECSPHEAKVLREHLDTCDECSKYYTVLQTTQTMAEKVSVPEISSQVIANIKQQAATRLPKPRSQTSFFKNIWPPFPLPRWTMAAAVIIIIALGTIDLSNRFSGSNQQLVFDSASIDNTMTQLQDELDVLEWEIKGDQLSMIDEDLNSLEQLINNYGRL